MFSNKIIECIKEIEEEQLENLIDSRLACLIEHDDFYTYDTNGILKTDKFLSKEDEIKSSLPSLVLDDIVAYRYLINNVRNMLQPNSDLQTVLKCVQKSVFDYYGIGIPNEIERIMTYKLKNKAEKLSVSEFRNSGNAWCTERAALAHNFMKFLGYEDVIVSKKVRINNIETLHVFNFVKENGKTYLYDFINTPTMKDVPLPEISFKEIDEKSAKMIFDSQKMVGNIDIGQVVIHSQKGREYIIDYSDEQIEKYDE